MDMRTEDARKAWLFFLLSAIWIQDRGCANIKSRTVNILRIYVYEKCIHIYAGGHEKLQKKSLTTLNPNRMVI